MFDIHKVKPVHGWREFIGEVGIIVLGVLIALGFEQIVETVHWRHKVRDTKETLANSVKMQSITAIEQQVSGPCVDKQLDALERKLFSAGVFQVADLRSDKSHIPFVIRAPSRPWSDTVWSTVNGEGVSTHYDPDFRELMDRFYSTLVQGHDIARQIDQIGGRLNALSRPIAKDPSVVAGFTQEIEEFRAKNAYLTLVAYTMLGYAAHAKMLPAVEDVRQLVYKQSGTIAFCRQNHITIGRPLIVDPTLR